MTLPSSGSLSVSQINGEYGLGNNLGAYRGVKWYKDNNARGYFPSGANAYIGVNSFYATRPTNPVSPGSAYLGTGYWTVPLFNTLYLQIKGGDGGQAGSYGVYVGGPNNGQQIGSQGGTAGGDSYIGSLISASGGGGGGGNGGAGGTGATSSNYRYITDGDQSLIPLQGQSVYVQVGAGGSGGRGGEINNWENVWIGYWTQAYVNRGYASSGANGSAGYCYASWS